MIALNEKNLIFVPKNKISVLVCCLFVARALVPADESICSQASSMIYAEICQIHKQTKTTKNALRQTNSRE